ncbi:unnamed protein product [Calicophoron daubneyi]|uniref:Protein UNC80 central region domain-containing protein n=1 Tax=Calicophoron daubneyi TaxID=300641 RepID=A0AAV2TIL5_CALDB
MPEESAKSDSQGTEGIIKMNGSCNSTSLSSATTNYLGDVAGQRAGEKFQNDPESAPSPRMSRAHGGGHTVLSRPSSRGSSDNILDVNEESKEDEPKHHPPLCRSFTDTDIMYNSTEKVEEVPGAMHYVSANGQIDYSVLLRALYWSSTVHTSSRVCAYLLKSMCALFDFNIMDVGPKAKHTPQFIVRKPININKLRAKLKIAGSKKSSLTKKASIVSRTHSRENRAHFEPSGRTLHKTKRESSSALYDQRRTSAFDYGRISGNTPLLHPAKRLHRSSVVISLELDGSDEEDEVDEESGHHTSGEPDKEASSPRGTQKDSVKTSHPSDSSQSVSSPKYRSGIRSLLHQYRSEAGTSYPSFPWSRTNARQLLRCSIVASPVLSTQYGLRYSLQTHQTFTTAWNQPSLALPKQPMLSQQVMRTNYALAVEMVLRIIRSLGCKYGHHGSPMFVSREAHTEPNPNQSPSETKEASRLTHDCLIHLYELNRSLFARSLSRVVATMCVADIMELLHALTGYCLDPAAYRVSQMHIQLNANSSYANSFGQTSTGYGTRGAEEIVISCLLGPFIRRLVRCRSELISQENMALFTDIRQLFSYLREVHGSTFRRNMLTAMLCPIQRACERPRPKVPSGWGRMSARNSMWFFGRPDKRRSSSVFSDGTSDYDGVVGGGGTCRGHRLTSWQSFMPRPSVVTRGVRLNSGAGSIGNVDRGSEGGYNRPDTDGAAQPVIEHRWVNAPALKEGLLDFAFLMECCEPGTSPEPQLIAALLDLDAPVVARACLLLECSSLVHRCNRGEWASWMKFNLPSSFQPNTATSSSSTMRTTPGVDISAEQGSPDMNIVKRNAGVLFHAWGEALGSRIRYFVKMMSAANSANISSNNPPMSASSTTQEKHKENSSTRQFCALESEENFLDDASVNPTGESCPYALLAVGVQLLLEITTYLREMHQRLPHAATNDGQQSRGQGQPGRESGGESSRRQGAGGDSSRSSAKHSISSASSGPRASFKAARRRLSILMPIFNPGGSGSTAESPTESTTGGQGGIEKSATSKSLLRRHRGSGSFKRLPADAQEALGAYGRLGSRAGARGRSNSGEAFVIPDEEEDDAAPSQSAEPDSKLPSEQEASSYVSTSQDRLTNGSHYPRHKSQTPGSRARMEEQNKVHSNVRRSISAAVGARRHRSPSIMPTTLESTEQEFCQPDSCSTHMPWIEAVIEFLN